MATTAGRGRAARTRGGGPDPDPTASTVTSTGLDARAASRAARVVPGGASPRALPLRTNVAWTGVGNAVYAGCQWGVLVAVARLSSPEVVGRLALAYALTAPIFLFAGLQLRAAQATDAAERFRFEDYFTVKAAGMLTALVAAAVIIAVAGYDRTAKPVVLGVAACKALEGMSDLHYGALQHEERMRPIAVSLVMRGVLSVTAVGAVLWLGGGIVLAVAAMAACWALVLVLHDRRATRPARAAHRARVDLAAAGQIAARSLPLGVVMMLISLRVNIPRYVIESHRGQAELGVYAAMSSLLVAGNVVVSALGQSATPRLARYHFEGHVRAFRRLLARLLAIAVGVGGVAVVVSVVAGAPLLRIVFGPAYASRADVFTWLMAAGLVAFTTSILGYGLTAARQFTIQLPIFALTTLLCAAGCWWLVPTRGLVGAVYGWGGSLLIELVAIWIVLERALRAPAKGGAR